MVYKQLRSSQQAKRHYLPFIIAAAVLLLLVVGLFLYGTGRLPFWRRTATIPVTHSSGNDSTKGEPTSSSQNQSGNTQTSGDTKNNGTNTSGVLIAPLSTSTFVSAHYNVKVSANLSSTCTTTPGATCQISFTKDGESHSLPAETTDAGGTAYWNNWQPQDYGLTPGSWTVTAIAKLGSQTMSTEDSLKLELVP